MHKTRSVYDSLISHFGEKNWWPVTEEGEIVPGPTTKKLTERQRFEIAAGAILTQNTNWNNVQKAIIEMNRRNIIDPKRIANINQETLARTIKSSGYYNQKAKKLKIFSHHILKHYSGNITRLFLKNETELREELLSLHGIGKETADTIILYAAEKPAFVIDKLQKKCGMQWLPAQKDVHIW